MNNKPIIIIAGEPYSVFLEIFFKTLKSKEIKLINSVIENELEIILDNENYIDETNENDMNDDEQMDIGQGADL